LKSRICPLLLSLFACATPSTPFEGRPVLTDIDFVGNESIKSGELRDKIATAPTSGFFSKTPRYYDADLFAIDVKRIVRWYNQKGFYEAKVTAVEELTDEEGRVRLLVHIEEGRRTYVKAVNFLGWEMLSSDQKSDVADSVELHPGDPFDEDAYQRSKDELVDQFKDRGFAEAQASGEVRIAMEDASATITFTVKPGKLFTFGKVVVTGNRAIPADEIIRATGISRGDLFRPRALALAQQRVYNLGAFSGVRVALEPLGDSPVAAVRVTVREAPFQTVRFGLGGKIEETRVELPRVHAEYTNRSILGGLKRLELASDLGYAFVPTLLNPEQTGVTTLTSAQITVPHVFEPIPGLDFVSRGEFARELQQDFGYDYIAARFALVYRISRHTITGSLNFVRYFDASLNGVDFTTLVQTGGQNLGLLSNCIPTCTLTYPELRYTFDSRDSVLEPTSGFFGTIDFQQTLKPGNFYYFRVEPEVRAYFPLRPWLVLAGRAQYGALLLEGDNQNAQASPFTQRFFGGGQNYQRGYQPLAQGPKVGGAPNAQGYWTQYASVGGNGSALLSGELRFRTDFLLRNSGIVLFTDASRITANPSLPWEGRLEIAPGIGLRYITPFGPVRLDVAYVVNFAPVTLASQGDVKLPNGTVVTTQNTVVSPDCIEATGTCVYQRRWTYHLTLGEGF
jgi:translocation and assembly module TamA